MKFGEYIEAVSQEEARLNKTALFTFKNPSGSYIFIMYDTEELRNAINSGEVLGMTKRELIENYIIAAGSFSKNKKLPLGAAKVNYSGSLVKGYGPLLYDIMLSYAGKKGLMPDRFEVSSYAGNVWNYYMNKRKDVKNIPIDDEDHPLTKDKADDGYVHDPIFPSKKIKSTKAVDRIYYLKDTSEKYAKLKRAHIKFINSLKESRSKRYFLQFLTDKNTVGDVYDVARIIKSYS